MNIPPYRPHVHYHPPHHPPRVPRRLVTPPGVYELERVLNPTNYWSIPVKAGQILGLIKPEDKDGNDLKSWLLKQKDRQDKKNQLALWELQVRGPNPSALAYRCYGSCLSDLERYEEALAAFEQAIRVDPNAPGYYVCKAEVLERLGRRNEAQQFYEKARQLGYLS